MLVGNVQWTRRGVPCIQIQVLPIRATNAIAYLSAVSVFKKATSFTLLSADAKPP